MRPYNEENEPPVISTIPAGAGFAIRLAARAIDLGYGFILSIVSGFCTGVFFAILSAAGKVDQSWIERIQEESATNYVVGILGAFLYHWYCEGIGGTTLGKLILGLRVVQEDGQPCSLIGALKRDLAYHVDGLFFGLIGYESMKKSPLRQRHGDKWGKTVVVQKAMFTPTPKVSTLRILCGLFVGSLAWMAIIFADLCMKVF